MLNQPTIDYDSVSHPTIFHEILRSKLPAREKTLERLGQEAGIVVGAGTLTTAWTLTVAMYQILSSPPILAKLKKELTAAIPDPSSPPPIAVLEKLPYLAAVIQESLRLSYGVCSRLQRIAPEETLVLITPEKTWEIPPGTPIGMSAAHVHHDESIFPDSRTFKPERWLDNPRLDRYLLSFSKGSRKCVGVDLAYAELNTVLATIFSTFGGSEKWDMDQGRLVLFETTEKDVLMAEDHLVPYPYKGTKGVRIMVVD